MLLHTKMRRESDPIRVSLIIGCMNPKKPKIMILLCCFPITTITVKYLMILEGHRINKTKWTPKSLIRKLENYLYCGRARRSYEYSSGELP